MELFLWVERQFSYGLESGRLADLALCRFSRSRPRTGQAAFTASRRSVPTYRVLDCKILDELPDGIYRIEQSPNIFDLYPTLLLRGMTSFLLVICDELE